jgi:hypothetical protein
VHDILSYSSALDKCYAVITRIDVLLVELSRVRLESRFLVTRTGTRHFGTRPQAACRRAGVADC